MRWGNEILVECGPLLSCIFLILLDRSHCLCLFICLNKLYFGIILDWTRLQQLHRISVYILPCSLTLTSFITTVHLSKLRNQHWYILLTNSTFYLGVTDFSIISFFCPKIQFRVAHFLLGTFCYSWHSKVALGLPVPPIISTSALFSPFFQKTEKNCWRLSLFRIQLNFSWAQKVWA